MKKVTSKEYENLEKDVLGYLKEMMRRSLGTGVESACLLMTLENGDVKTYRSNTKVLDLIAYATELQTEAMHELSDEWTPVESKFESKDRKVKKPSEQVKNMTREELERHLLEKLRQGKLDGSLRISSVCDTTWETLIKDGIPYRIVYPTSIGPKEGVIRIHTMFETDEGKLWFLRNQGYMVDDSDVCHYTRTYRRYGRP